MGDDGDGRWMLKITNLDISSSSAFTSTSRSISGCIEAVERKRKESSMGHAPVLLAKLNPTSTAPYKDRCSRWNGGQESNTRCGYIIAEQSSAGSRVMQKL